MVQEMVAAARPKMEATLQHLTEELKTVRTGRASAQMLDGVMVMYYGTQTHLKQLATINVPEPTQILIQPFDANAVSDIVTAIRSAELGFNPTDDGRSVRITVPPLTAERREELAKKVGKMAEAARISVRTIRGDIWEDIQKAQKAAEISEDNREWGRDEIDKLTGEYNKKIEEIAKVKEGEILSL